MEVYSDDDYTYLVCQACHSFTPLGRSQYLSFMNPAVSVNGPNSHGMLIVRTCAPISYYCGCSAHIALSAIVIVIS